ncbi:hypothetical protein NLJ89_g3083 [Agrocybe chaxingu]|uniref:Cytochrome P450 n=1 Tax=Agrocybe chaxingu TaxID=84603 RepID=A0A9W8KAC5_9AGAR|nr:hypothetical protein NLJ89_g3083 [Agrocybe chaxingu]
MMEWLLGFSTLIAALYLLSRHFVSHESSTESPPAVPYLIPWLGSTLQFARDPVSFLERCRRRYGRIYRIVVAGSEIVVVADAASIAELERDVTKSLDKVDLVARAVRVVTGINIEGDQAVYEVMKNKIFPRIAKAFSQTAMTSHFLKEVDRELVAQLVKMGSSAPSTILNLLDVTARPLYCSTCIALFGPTFPYEDTYYDFKLLDSNFNQLNTGIPFVALNAVRARKHIFRSTVRFISSWWDGEGTQYIPGISELGLEWLQELKTHGLSKTQASTVLIFVLWGSQTNIWEMSFWLLHHLASDLSSQEKLREEANKFNERRGESDIDTSLTPLLNSAMTETLRWVSKTGIVRRVIKDMRVMVENQVVHISKESILYADVGAVHSDPTIYPHPDQFDINRFLSWDNSQHGAQPAPMAWGGGAHFVS